VLRCVTGVGVGLALAAAVWLRPEADRLRSDFGALGQDLSAAAWDIAADRNVRRSGAEAGLIVHDAGAAVAGSVASTARRLSRRAPTAHRSATVDRPAKTANVHGRFTIVLTGPPPEADDGVLAGAAPPRGVVSGP
jgi:hypothetical protein